MTMCRTHDITNVQRGYPERIDPHAAPVGILNWHLKKYDFARHLCLGKRVLDAGCGSGYGGNWLAPVAERIVAADIDRAALAYASGAFEPLRGCLVMSDVQRMPFAAGSFDIICNFENIEHLPAPEAFLSEVLRVLKKHGILIVSTPISRVTTRRPRNPHHHIEWSPEDFRALLEMYFSNVEILGQVRRQSRIHRVTQRLDVFGLRRWLLPPRIRRGINRALRTTSIESLELDDFDITATALKYASEMIAVCRKGEAARPMEV